MSKCHLILQNETNNLQHMNFTLLFLDALEHQYYEAFHNKSIS